MADPVMTGPTRKEKAERGGNFSRQHRVHGPADRRAAGGPGTPAWHEALLGLQAIQRQRRRRIIKALLAAREHLESGRDYRSIRAGPGFTAKVMQAVEEEQTGRSAAPASTATIATIIAVAAGLMGLAVLLTIGYFLYNSGNAPQQATLA